MGGDLDGRVVDQQVDRAVPGLDPTDQGAQVVAVGEVAGDGPTAHLRHEGVEGAAAPGDAGDVGPGRGEVGGEPGPDVTGGPGEQDVGSGDAHPASVHDGGSRTGIRRAGGAPPVSNVPPCGRGAAPS